MDKRGDGILRSIPIEADTLAEAWHEAMLACYENGVRTLDPQYQGKEFYSYDGDININVRNPLQEPMRHRYGVIDVELGMMQYILEFTHGIHNHWKRNPDDPNDTRWGYTYNERFASQIPFHLKRIEQDWEKRKDLSSRKYFIDIGRPREDAILEQTDPPCFRGGHFRFLKDDKGEWWLNYITTWRSRDLAKAWLENCFGQTKLQKLLADKVSDMLEIPIHVGAYIDKNSSLHIYGRYFEDDHLGGILEEMKKMPLENIGMPIFMMNSESELKRVIAAQTDAEDKGLGKNLNEDALKKLGYNLENFPYPKDWDSWPKEWDLEPDKSSL